MTFCMAFFTNPDGIAVIADTRITLSNSFQDGFQKVIFPTKNSLIAVAGQVEILSFVLLNISAHLEKFTADGRLDALRAQIRDKFKLLLQTSTTLTPEDGASIIYGDMRLEKGPTRCRLMRFDLSISHAGEPILTEQTGKSFATDEAKKFPQDKRTHDLPWLCIGLNPGTRNFIGNTAISNVQSLLTRGLKVVANVDSGAIPSHGRVYSEVLIRGSSMPRRGRMVFTLDSSGPADGSFLKQLRGFINEQRKENAHGPGDVIQHLGQIVLKRIELLMTEIPGSIGLDTLSETWSLATISRGRGQELMTGTDSNGVTLGFGLKTELD